MTVQRLVCCREELAKAGLESDGSDNPSQAQRGGHQLGCRAVQSPRQQQAEAALLQATREARACV